MDKLDDVDTDDDVDTELEVDTLKRKKSDYLGKIKVSRIKTFLCKRLTYSKETIQIHVQISVRYRLFEARKAGKCNV